MKTMLAIFVIICFCACKSVTFETRQTNYTIDDLGYDMYRYVKMYYCQYLVYPTLEELYFYCWDITNSANNYQYSSFSEYEKAGNRNTNAVGAESFNRFLFYNKHDLKFQVKENVLKILWRKKVLFELDFDYCEMKNDRSNLYQFSNYYDASGVAFFIDFEDIDSINSIKKTVFKKCNLDQSLLRREKELLLRYSVNDGYKFLCYADMDINEERCLRELQCVLDTFLKGRNMEMVQLVVSVP